MVSKSGFDILLGVSILVTVIMIAIIITIFTMKPKKNESCVKSRPPSDLNQYEKKIFSQNGEDGITLEIISRLNLKKSYFVEFGVEDGSQCNTRILREYKSWTGLLMDGSYENKDINLKKEFITKENIIELFEKYNVPKSFGLLSIDIDYNDFHVLHEILKKYSMDIIILEYNAFFLPDEDAVIKYDKYGMWDGSNYFGASLLSFQKLLNKFNYSLIYTEKMGVNAFFVKNIHKDKFNISDDIHKLYNTPKYGKGPRGGHKKDTKERQFISSNTIL